jgi:hypothetical protein
MSNRIKKFDGGGEVGGSGFAWGLAQEMANPELGMISDAQYTDRIISMIEDGYYYGQTPEQLAAADLGLSVAQMNAKTEDMLDSILSSQGENETGFVNESARIAAEGILKGKIAQAGVTDPAAQEAALNSAMESLEQGGSGLEAVKAAAGGAKNYVEEVLGSAKDILDKGYDAVFDKLPDWAKPRAVGVDPTTGQTTAVFGDPVQGTSVLGGQVGTVGGGTYAGVTTTGNAALDAVLAAVKDGVGLEDLGTIVGAATGIPGGLVDAAVNTAKVVKEGVEKTTLDEEDKGTKVFVNDSGAGPTDLDEDVMGPQYDPDKPPGTVVPDDKVTPSERVIGDPFVFEPPPVVLDEVTPSERVIGDPFVFEPPPVVLDEVTPSERVIGDPFVFEPPPVVLDEVPPVALEEVPPPPPEEVPEVPRSFAGTTTRRMVPGDLVDIEYLYDIGGPSIFAPTMQDEEDKYRPYVYSGFAEGGIVQESDLEQLLKKIRG